MDYRHSVRLVRHSLALLATLAVVLGVGFAPAASAAPGQLDPSFGSGGVVRMLFSEETTAIRGAAVQPDGKIVLAGSDSLAKTTLVIRLLDSGALDPGFGAGGVVNLKLGSDASEGRAVLIQPDGKIVIAGAAKGPLTYDFVVARLNPDGSPDPGFGGGDGNELISLGFDQHRAEALALGPGGRIVATGEARKTTPAEVVAGVVVLGPNGLPDPGYFGGDGAMTITTALKNDEGVAVAMLADGRVLVGDANGAGGGKGFTLVQLLAAGTPDPAFGGGDGLVEAPVPSAGTETSLGGRIDDFQLLADGRIVASGYGYDQVGSPPTSDGKLAVARFLPDGQLDASFGSAGWFSHQIGTGSEDADAVQVAPTGRLVLGGAYTFTGSKGPNNTPYLARLEPGGGLDPGFGAGGLVPFGETAPFGENFEALALDPEERALVVGRAYLGNNNTEVVVRRFLGDKVPRGPNQAPHARMKRVPKKLKANRLRGFVGSASDSDGTIAKVQVALLKLVPGGAKASAKRAAPKCLALRNARAKFKPAKPKGAKGKKRCQPRWLGVKGKEKWSFRLKKNLPPGRYVVYARAVDAEGLAESTFSRKAGNRYAFRVLPAD